MAEEFHEKVSLLMLDLGQLFFVLTKVFNNFGIFFYGMLCIFLCCFQRRLQKEYQKNSITYSLIKSDQEKPWAPNEVFSVYSEVLNQ